MRSILLAAAMTALSVSAFAASPQKDKDKCKDKEDAACGCTYIPPRRDALPLYEMYDTRCGNILGLQVDALYMVYDAAILTYAANQITTSSTRTLTSDVFGVPGQMSLGCNIEATYTMGNQPGYTFSSSWYHIVAQMKRTDNVLGLFPSHSVTLAIAAPGHGSVNAHLTINLFDLLIKKDYALGDWFFFTPAAGIVGGFMDGVNNAHFKANAGSAFNVTGPLTTVAPTSATLDYTTKYEGIGLKLGGSTAYKIWRGFKLKADLYYSVLYGYSKSALFFNDNGVYNGLSTAFSNYNQHHGRAFFDSLLGLSWETRFCSGDQYLEVHAGWRFQSYSDGWKEFEAEFNDAVHELSVTGQGLQAGVIYKF